MNNQRLLFPVGLTALAAFTACTTASNKAVDENNAAIHLDTKTMKRIGTVDERYQSYNVEMVEVVGGKFWKPYKLMDSTAADTASGMAALTMGDERMFRKMEPINLADPRLVRLAQGLAPAYVRVSGTWANATYFQDDDQPARAVPKGYVNVLTRAQWKGVVDFIQATNGALVTSFAVSNGVRDAKGLWTPVNAAKLVAYTKSLGGSVAAAELFNEPNIPGAGGELRADYDVAAYARDEQAFRAWAKKDVPDMLVAGPGAIGEGLEGVSFEELGQGTAFFTTESMLSAEPRPDFDVYSYHFYGAASARAMKSGPFSIQPANALKPAWLTRTDQVADRNVALRDKYQPGKPIWLTETAEAAAGGDPFAVTYLDCFRYLYQLGSLARKGVQVVMHNTLAASEYSLIDQDTHLPKPNYWAAYLWAQLMGTEVYDAGTGKPGTYLFAHNTKGQGGGITVLVINTNDSAAPVHLPAKAQRYTLTSTGLDGTTVLLNGTELKLTATDELPPLQGQAVEAGTLELPAHSISFLTIAGSVAP